MNHEKEINRLLRAQAKLLRKSSKKRKKKNKPKPFSNYDKRWQRLRRQVFDAYGKKCMKCGNCDELHVDHIKPKSKFPKLAYRFSNMQVLCKTCNELKSNKHCTDYRLKFEQEEYELAMIAELTNI
jgi:5-methylcytosine-specific restriction endonuclease McrA